MDSGRRNPSCPREHDRSGVYGASIGAGLVRRVRRDSHSVPPDLARACANAGEPDFNNQDKLRWHAQQTGNVLAVLKTGPDGLTAQEAESRKQRFGPNRLAAAPKRSEIL